MGFAINKNWAIGAGIVAGTHEGTAVIFKLELIGLGSGGDGDNESKL